MNFNDSNEDPFKEYDNTIKDSEGLRKSSESGYSIVKSKFDLVMSTVGQFIKFTIWKWYYLITIPSIFVLYKLLQNEAFQKAVVWVLEGFGKGVNASYGIISNCLVTDMGGLLHFFDCVSRQ